MKKIFSILLCLSVTACSTVSNTNIQMNVDKNVSFSQYKSFYIEQFHVPSHYLALNKKIDPALKNALIERGLHYSSSKEADLLIRYGVKVEHGQQVVLTDYNIGTLGATPEMRTQIEPVHKGVFLMNIVDRKSDNIILKASSNNPVFEGIHFQNITQKEITEAIENILERFPDFTSQTADPTQKNQR